MISAKLRKRLAEWLAPPPDPHEMLAALSPNDFGGIMARRVAADPEGAFEMTGEEVMAYAFYSRLRRILRAWRPDLVIDAGAHTGQFGGIVNGYCEYRGTVISFEPVQTFFAQLQKNADFYAGWETVNAALGDVDGEMFVNIGKGHGGTSSMLAQTGWLAELAQDVQLGERQPVRQTRLDTFLAARFGDEIPERILLKLDVQGFEEQVFASAGIYESRIKLLLCELATVPFYEGQKTFGAMCALFADRGFVPILIHNNFGHGSLIHFDYDLLFCRQDELLSLSRAVRGQPVPSAGAPA